MGNVCEKCPRFKVRSWGLTAAVSEEGRLFFKGVDEHWEHIDQKITKHIVSIYGLNVFLARLIDV